MKSRMKWMSPRCGRWDCSGSTASVAMVVLGMSERKLSTRICRGSSGRNGRNAEAAAMLAMLPKLALTVVKTYLSVLAKVCRPSRTPWPSTPRSLSSSTIAAALLATSTAVSTEIPTSARCSAPASLSPARQVVVVQGVDLASREQPGRVHADLGGDVGGRQPVVAGDHPDADARLG